MESLGLAGGESLLEEKAFVTRPWGEAAAFRGQGEGWGGRGLQAGAEAERGLVSAGRGAVTWHSSRWMEEGRLGRGACSGKPGSRERGLRGGGAGGATAVV